MLTKDRPWRITFEAMGAEYNGRVDSPNLIANWLFRTLVACLVAVTVLVSGARASVAAEDDETPAPVDESKSAKPVKPRLDLDDDPLGRSRSSLAAMPADDVERPFWKGWVFWAVTGVLVAGAVGLVAYSASGSTGSLSPCPGDVTLGCFGAGRGQ